ncbi:MAG TPA: ABC transporter ATP-binding protein [Paenibacillus sp.]|jgi:putative ABC transport system ATP-binding protein
MIKFDHICKTYQIGEVEVNALQEVSFEIMEGELVIILGASGAGKSTILNLLGGMDKATSGEIMMNGRNITTMNERELTDYRGKAVGFVFQFYNLIPNLTAEENVEYAAEFTDKPHSAKEVLTMVGLDDRLSHFPSQLSGGEQQRVAIARAIAKNPKILLCDEPTGALDYETGKSILKLLQRINREQNKTIVLITHNSLIAPVADRVIKMKSGRVEYMIRNEEPQSVEGIEW